jgi:DNA polymerase elongation subunit (family B)
MLFVDIETVPQYKQFSDMDSRGQELFKKKFKKQLEDTYYFQILEAGDIPIDTKKSDTDFIIEKVYQDNAALHAEWGRIACVTVGFTYNKDDKSQFRVKTIINRDESVILKSLIEMLLRDGVLCGHNIKAFDIPFLYRRFQINRVRVPSPINMEGKKPWDVAHMDTMELWACGEFNKRVSLDLLCYILDIDSPKQEMDGSHVKDLWYSGEIINHFNKISAYCEGDVIAQARVYHKLKNMTFPEEIVYVTE